MIKLKPLLTEASDKQIGQEIISQITNGNPSRFGNMMKGKWFNFRDKGIEFEMKSSKYKIGFIQKRDNDKYDVEFLNWNKDGKRPLDLGKKVKNVKGMMLYTMLKRHARI